MSKKLVFPKGKRFGRLTVIGEGKPRKGRSTTECICDCGKKTIVITASLKRGLTKSCGCLKTIDWNRKEKICWFCGEIKPTSSFYRNKSRKDGITTECKECSAILANRLYEKKYKNKDFDVLFRFRHYVACAKRRNIVFSLTLKEFDDLTSQKCFLCGKHSPNKNYSGIDRMNNDKGYIKSNCVPCCEICNRLKYKLSVETIYNHLGDIFYHLKKQGKEL